MAKLKLNKIYHSDALNFLKRMPDDCIDCIVTSPPYWGLRDYGIEGIIWDGDKNCEHEWKVDIKKPLGGKGSKCANVGANKNDFSNMRDHNIVSNFCNKCGAWKGQLGLEPTFELYIKHLCDIFNEVQRVLKKTGTCWVVIGDTYMSSGGASRHFGYSDPKYKKGRCGNFIEPAALPQKKCIA